MTGERAREWREREQEMEQENKRVKKQEEITHILNRLLKYIFTTLLLLSMSGAAMASSVAESMLEKSTQEKEAIEEDLEKSEDLYAGAKLLDDATPKTYRISKINVHGIEMFNQAILTSSAGINVGDSITLPSPFVASVIQRLWNQRRYADVNVSATITGDDVEIDLLLKEQARVFNWAIEGVREGLAKDIMKKLDLRRNSELSDYVLDKNIVAIKKYFHEKGFRNVDVEAKISADSLNSFMANVTFDVNKGRKVKVGEIIFEGNENIDEKKLRSSMKKTNQGGLMNLLKSRKFDVEGYRDDKELVIDYYNSKGYRNATILADSVYDVSDNRLGVYLKVSEGNKYYIRDVTWVGNSRYETEMLNQMLGVAPGSTYDKKTMYKRLGIGKDANPSEMSILTLYQNDGYLMSQVDPAETIIGADSIDLELKIFEGRPFTINEVSITGNLKVNDDVIRREIYTRPGELYNRSLLMRTIQVLGSIGHFNAEAIMPDINPVSNELVDIGWVLEEQASDQFNISGGWGSGSFIGSVGITLNNLSTREFFSKGAWRPYPMGQSQSLSLQAQTNGTYYKALSMSFTEPWMGGRKANSFTIGVHYSDQNDAYYAWSESTQYFRTLGVSAGLGKRLAWPDPYFTLYGELGYNRYMLKDWYDFLMEDGDANLISAKVVVARSTVDQQIYPRSGTSFTGSLQVTPPYSLFNDKDYSDEDMTDEERYKYIEFHKWNFKMEWYQSFMRNSNLVLMLRAEMGFLGSYDKNLSSPFERFEVGGDGMTGYNYYGVDIIGLRGYEDGALDPIDSEYSLAYNKYTVELRYPLMMESSTQIYALAFVEAGNGFKSWRDFSPFDIKRSAGVGVRLYLPIVGLMGFDWGYGFDPASGSTSKSGGQFHFTMGQSF